MKGIKKSKDKQSKKKSEKLDYEIIASGSSGNCVVIENIMIDAGVPYKTIKEHLYDIDYLLFTHMHGDHYKESTYKRIRKEFPNIITAANESLHRFAEEDFDIVIRDNVPLKLGEYEIVPFPGIHNVEVHGFDWYVNGQHVIYMTDSNSLEFAPCEDKYDYLFLESNHDDRKMKATFRQSKKYGYNVYRNGKRHMSTQKSKEFYLNNRRSRDSKWIELHKSERFY